MTHTADDTPTLDAGELEILATAIGRAATTQSGVDLDAALDEIGWVDAVEFAPRTAVATLFEQQGSAHATSSALGRLLLRSLDVPCPPGTAVVLPWIGTARPPVSPSPDATGARHGLAAADLATSSDTVLLSLADGVVRWTSRPTDTLTIRSVDGLDPSLGLVEVSLPADVDRDAEDWATASGKWDDAVARCQLALGHELVGTMRTMLEMAREHALDRVQFDRPIAGFQAVRHRLAEALVAIEAADAALDGAWQDGSPLAATMAKAVCGHSARTVRRHCQQVLAGIGFTTEHDLHLYVRRSIVLDGLFGDARSLTAEIGAAVIERRDLPRLLPL